MARVLEMGRDGSGRLIRAWSTLDIERGEAVTRLLKRSGVTPDEPGGALLEETRIDVRLGQ